MSTQQKLSAVDVSNEEALKMKQILNLEKYYFDMFWELFTSSDFIEELLYIERDIQNNYESLNNLWDLKNKLKIPAERLARKYVYKNLSDIIYRIFPSPVSGDIAFITHNAVINIDVKTQDIIGNKGDISKLQFESNQSSFVNKNLDANHEIMNSGVRVECCLPTTYCFELDLPKPVLTYFLTIVYEDDNTSFSISRNDALPTIQLKCLPNGIISSLFEYDIVDNFKTYSYFEEKDGFSPIYLTDNSKDVNILIQNYVNEHIDKFKLIEGRRKLGIFEFNRVHPYYDTLGVSYFPVRKKKKTEPNEKYYLKAVKSGHTNRVDNKTLEIRYDGNDEIWYGIKKYTIK